VGHHAQTLSDTQEIPQNLVSLTDIRRIGRQPFGHE
jgi:hypothetical protein